MTFLTVPANCVWILAALGPLSQEKDGEVPVTADRERRMEHSRRGVSLLVSIISTQIRGRGVRC